MKTFIKRDGQLVEVEISELDLSPEQKAIVEEREKRKQKRLDIVDQIDKLAFHHGLERQKLLDELRDTDTDLCEHGRSYASPCLACEELDAKLGFDYPRSFNYYT